MNKEIQKKIEELTGIKFITYVTKDELLKDISIISTGINTVLTPEVETDTTGIVDMLRDVVGTRNSIVVALLTQMLISAIQSQDDSADTSSILDVKEYETKLDNIMERILSIFSLYDETYPSKEVNELGDKGIELVTTHLETLQLNADSVSAIMDGIEIIHPHKEEPTVIKMEEDNA